MGHFLESFLRYHDRSRLQLELIETQPRWEERNRSLRALAHDALLLPQADLAGRRALIRERGYQVIVETFGFTTASGLPLLAIRGATLAGRMSTAVLEGFGEPGWIAHTPEAFAAIARQHTADLPALRAGRAERQRRAWRGPCSMAPIWPGP